MCGLGGCGGGGGNCALALLNVNSMVTVIAISFNTFINTVCDNN